jgi:bifunctional enzyme CysN/CysC
VTDQQRSPDVVWQHGNLDRDERWSALGQRGATLWLTGLPAAGKSTVAGALERALVDTGRFAYVLDGDNVRHGLSGDLGFDAAARHENVRRVAHVARLFADAGAVAIVSLVSPFAADRDRARALHDEAGLDFFEVFIDTPLEECERRDPKGLYARARAGSLKGLTGVGDPYEPPADPELVVRTTDEPLEASIARILDALSLPRPA